MKNQKFQIILILLAMLISLGSGCEEAEDCPTLFHIPAEFIPYKKEYHIGDTIKIVSKFHRYVYELTTGKKYDFNQMDWNPNSGLSLLDTIGFTKISDYFKIISLGNYREYIFNEGYSTLEGQYNFQQDTYNLEITIIPKRMGNYLFNQLCGIGPGHGDVDFPGKCKKFSYDVIVEMNAGKDGNIELLKESQDSLYNYWVLLDPKARFYKRGGFCFKVVP